MPIVRLLWTSLGLGLDMAEFIGLHEGLKLQVIAAKCRIEVVAVQQDKY